MQPDMIQVEHLGRNDQAGVAMQPALGSRARHAKRKDEGRITCRSDQLSESVIVGLLRSLSYCDHGPSMVSKKLKPVEYSHGLVQEVHNRVSSAD